MSIQTYIKQYFRLVIQNVTYWKTNSKLYNTVYLCLSLLCDKEAIWMREDFHVSCFSDQLTKNNLDHILYGQMFMDTWHDPPWHKCGSSPDGSHQATKPPNVLHWNKETQNCSSITILCKRHEYIIYQGWNGGTISQHFWDELERHTMFLWLND